MGIFSRAPKISPAAPIVGPKQIIVVGDEHYPVVRKLKAGPLAGVTVEPEPRNKYDANAVLVRVQGEPAGYLSAARAATYRPIILGRHPVEALVKPHSINSPGLTLFVMMPRK